MLSQLWPYSQQLSSQSAGKHNRVTFFLQLFLIFKPRAIALFFYLLKKSYYNELEQKLEKARAKEERKALKKAKAEEERLAKAEEEIIEVDINSENANEDN